MKAENENIPLNKSNSETMNIEDINANPETEEMIKKENSSGDSSLPLLDEILDGKGYILKTFKFIILCSLMISLEGIQTNIFGFILIPMQKYYQVSEKALGVVSSISFLGIGLGSLLSGLITQKFGRTQSINFLLCVNALCSILCWLIHDFIVFAILRFCMGFSLGLFEPVTLNILAEYLPIKHRAFVLTSVWIAFQLGAIYTLIIIMLIMPNYESVEVPKIMLFSSFIPVIAFVISIFLLEDSIRNYILNDDTAQAFNILEKDYELELSLEKKRLIEDQVKNHNKLTSETNFFSIFSREVFVLTILLSLIWFIDLFVSYGTGIITSLTLKNLEINQDQNYIQITLDQLYMNVLGGVGTIIGGLLCEINHLGRVKTTVLTTFISAVLLFIIPFFSKYFTFIFCVTQFFWFIAINVNTTYTCEVYPTSIRDQAVGFLFFITRMGAFFSQYLYLVFNYNGIFAPYYISAGLFFFNTIITWCLPVETYGRPLDFKIHNPVEDSNTDERKDFKK